MSTFISSGYDDHLRQCDRINLDEAHYRFRRYLPSNVKIIDFTKHLEKNYNRSINDLLLHTPMSQSEMVNQINTVKFTESYDVSISIAYSWRLKLLDGISDKVCKRLKGLFLFAAVKLNSDSLLKFIARCENISSLTVACMNEMDATFMTKVFARKLLPKLEFLEVSYASDDTIAAMVSSPKLRTIIFRIPDKDITNTGFQRLVQAGGAKNLMAIQASANRTEISCTLSVGYLRKILPKFVTNEAKLRDMICMSFTTNFVTNTVELPSTSPRRANIMFGRKQINTLQAKEVRRQPLSVIKEENTLSADWPESSSTC